jgi:L-threonylcarbamoyladenylate synthase
MSLPTDDLARKCAHAIREGHVTALFTSFGWTFVCDPGNVKAVNKLTSVTASIEKKYRILLLDETGRLNRFLKEIPESAPDIMEFSQKPLIVWFAGALNVIPEIMDEQGAAPFLLTTDEVLKNTVYRFGKPILAVLMSDNTIQPEEVLAGADTVITLQRRKTEPFEPSVVRYESGGSFRIIQK